MAGSRGRVGLLEGLAMAPRLHTFMVNFKLLALETWANPCTPEFSARDFDASDS
jgi:hypothetical protein